MTTLHEECGVFGAYDLNGDNVASSIYYGLLALQPISVSAMCDTLLPAQAPEKTLSP